MILRKILKLRFCKSKPTFYSELELQDLLQNENPLKQIIKEQILTTNGQMKFSRYWNLCNTHPEFGFYSQKNVFSKGGHFTTSPEISSIFGEIIGVWMMHFVSSIAKTYSDVVPNKNNTMNLRPFRLIQFGPGRGLLMADILRCISQLNGLQFLHSVTMIQTSSQNTQLQQKSVLDELAKKDHHFSFSYNNPDQDLFVGQNNNIQLRWFKSLYQMMKKDYGDINQIKKQIEQQQKSNPPFTIVLAHQFFDALPTQSLIFTKDGWRQRVIKLDSNNNLVMVPSSYPIHEKFIPQITNPQINSTVQISHESLMLMQTISQIISQTNGVVLNIDYGNNFAHSDSIRAIRDHKYVPFPQWVNLPGLCDLSAYVDFSSLQQFSQKTPGIKGFEPLPQGYFLQAMGINVRIQVLSKHKSQQIKKRMQQDYERLVSPQMMGQIYKIQMITKKQNQQVYPFLTEQDNNFV